MPFPSYAGPLLTIQPFPVGSALFWRRKMSCAASRWGLCGIWGESVAHQSCILLTILLVLVDDGAWKASMDHFFPNAPIMLTTRVCSLIWSYNWGNSQWNPPHLQLYGPERWKKSESFSEHRGQSSRRQPVRMINGLWPTKVFMAT